MSNVQAVFNSLPPHVQRQHREAWAALEPRLKALAGKKAKVFEVHHLVETARKVYFDGLASYHAADACARAVVTQFGL